MNQKGFTHILALFLVVSAILLMGYALVIGFPENTQCGKVLACHGVLLGNTCLGYKSTFVYIDCPNTNHQFSTSSPISTPLVDPTANWKTYTNAQYGYSIKYPSGWIITSKITQPQLSYQPMQTTNIYTTRLLNHEQISVPVSIAIYGRPYPAKSLLQWLETAYARNDLTTVQGGTIFDALSRVYNKGQGILLYNLVQTDSTTTIVDVGSVATNGFFSYGRFILKADNPNIYAIELQLEEFNKNAQLFDVPDSTIVNIFNQILSTFTFTNQNQTTNSSVITPVVNQCGPVLFPNLTWSAPIQGKYIFGGGLDIETLSGYEVTAPLSNPNSQERNAFFSFYETSLQSMGWNQVVIASAPTTLGQTETYKKGQQWLTLEYSSELVNRVNKASIEYNAWCQ